MNTVFDRRHAERFAELLDETDGGRRRSQIRAEAQLAQLVTLGDKLGGVRVPGPAADFRAGLRAQLLAAAEREGIGITAVEPEPAKAKPRRSHRARVAIAAGVLCTLAASGISMASGDAKPGDALYSVKRSTEKAQLALAGSDLSRGQLYLEFARTRLSEADAVRGNAEGFGGAMVDMDANTMDGVRLLTTSAVAHNDPTALDAVDKFLDDQRHLVNQLAAVVGAGARATVDTSLVLLDALAARSHALRAALACGVGSIQKSDSLGPLAQACPPPAGAQPQTAPQKSVTSTGGKPTVAPSSASEAASALPRPAAKVAARHSAAEDGGLVGELGRILADFLGR